MDGPAAACAPVVDGDDTSPGTDRDHSQERKRTASEAGHDASPSATSRPRDAKRARTCADFDSGIKNAIAETVASTASCAPLTDEQIAAIGSFLHAPENVTIVARTLRFAEDVMAAADQGVAYLTLNTLPGEIVIALASYCDLHSMDALRATCRSIRHVLDSPAADEAWERACYTSYHKAAITYDNAKMASKSLYRRLSDMHFVDRRFVMIRLNTMEARFIDDLQQRHYGYFQKRISEYYDGVVETQLLPLAKRINNRYATMCAPHRIGGMSEFLSHAVTLVEGIVRYGIHMMAGQRRASFDTFKKLMDTSNILKIVLDPRIEASASVRWAVCRRILDYAAVWHPANKAESLTYAKLIAAYGPPGMMADDVVPIYSKADAATGTALLGRELLLEPASLKYIGKTLPGSTPRNNTVSAFRAVAGLAVAIAVAVKNGWEPLGTILRERGSLAPSGHRAGFGIEWHESSAGLSADAASAASALAAEPGIVKSARVKWLDTGGGQEAAREALSSEDVPLFAQTGEGLATSDSSELMRYRRYVELFVGGGTELRARIVANEYARMMPNECLRLLAQMGDSQNSATELCKTIGMACQLSKVAPRDRMTCDDMVAEAVMHAVSASLYGGGTKVPIDVNALVDAYLRGSSTMNITTRSEETIDVEISPECVRALYNVVPGNRVSTSSGTATVMGIRKRSDANDLWFIIDGDSGISFWRDATNRKALKASGVNLSDPITDMSAARVSDGSLKAISAALTDLYASGQDPGFDYLHPLHLELMGMVSVAGRTGGQTAPPYFYHDTYADAGVVMTMIAWMVRWVRLPAEERERTWLPAVVWLAAKASLLNDDVGTFAKALGSSGAPPTVRTAFAHWVAETVRWPSLDCQDVCIDEAHGHSVEWVHVEREAKVVRTYPLLVRLLATVSTDAVSEFLSERVPVSEFLSDMGAAGRSGTNNSAFLGDACKGAPTDFRWSTDRTAAANMFMVHARIAAEAIKELGDCPTSHVLAQDVIRALEAVPLVPTKEEVEIIPPYSNGTLLLHNWWLNVCAEEGAAFTKSMSEHVVPLDTVAEGNIAFAKAYPEFDCATHVPTYSSFRVTAVLGMAFDAIFHLPALTDQILDILKDKLVHHLREGGQSACTNADLVCVVKYVTDKVKNAHRGIDTPDAPPATTNNRPSDWLEKASNIFNNATFPAWRAFLSELIDAVARSHPVADNAKNYDLSSTARFRAMTFASVAVGSDIAKFMADPTRSSFAIAPSVSWDDLEKHVKPLGISLDPIQRSKNRTEQAMLISHAPIYARIARTDKAKFGHKRGAMHVVITKYSTTPYDRTVLSMKLALLELGIIRSQMC